MDAMTLIVRKHVSGGTGQASQCRREGAAAATGYPHLKATLALDIHEERVWRLDQSLELVLLLLFICRRVQQIDIVRERLRGKHTLAHPDALKGH